VNFDLNHQSEKVFRKKVFDLLALQRKIFDIIFEEKIFLKESS